MNAFAGLERYGHLLELIDAWEGGQACSLADWVLANITPAPRSVVDVGCASGLYLEPYREHGAVVLGLDGAPTAGSRLGQSEYLRHDLRQAFVLPGKYDLCLCLETAEHIEPEFADVFVDSVAACSDLILFSAAAPGQGGEGHFNLQPRAYWLDKFAAHGFGLHALDGALRALVTANVKSEFHPWLIANGCLLGRSSVKPGDQAR